MLRIWFNRTYSTNMHTIALLRDNPDGQHVKVYATHADLATPVPTVSDVADLEPDRMVTGAQYVDWAIDYCSHNGIDVFVPTLHLAALAGARDRFTRAGVAMVAGPADAIALLDDKGAAYADAVEAGLAVPPHRVVTDADEILAAYDELTAEVGEVCIKPVTGVGGSGFRVLSNSRTSWEDLAGAAPPKVYVGDAAEAVRSHLAAGGAPRRHLIMPVLPAPEVSVDCLADSSGNLLAAVAREKKGNLRRLEPNAEAVDMARRVVSRHRLSSISNTQVRYWAHPLHDSEDRPYLLETNARMSGGLYQTALTGLNLPWAAVCLALDRQVRIPEPKLGIACTTVTTLVQVARS